MTLYIWDASHYDGELSVDTLKRARDEGIVMFTHKISEGATYIDPLAVLNLTNAKTAGIEFIGGYHVVRSSAIGPQVDNALRASPPWWRDFPGWCGQTDLEHWDYDAVTASTGIEFSRAWREAMARAVLLYASHGQYGDQLTGWDGPLWNADYTSHAPAGFVAMYPGDAWTPLHNNAWRGGWTPYSGQAPALLQYTSQATIAGHTTCDANAYRGTIEQLRALLTGHGGNYGPIGADEMTQEEHIWLYNMAQLTYAMAALWDEVSLQWAFTDANHTIGQAYTFDLRPYWARVGGVALTPADVAVVAAAAGKGAADAVAGLSFDLKLEGTAEQSA